MFPFFTPFGLWAYTPALPAFYFNAKTQEEIIKHLACEYKHITDYLEQMTSDVNNTLEQLDTQIKSLQHEVAQLHKAIANLEQETSTKLDMSKIYDPTQGDYVDSKIAMRNMYRELAVFGARIAQINNLTVEQLSKYNVDDTSSTGNLTIFNNNTPRVTDKDTGLAYESEQK